MYLLKMEMRLKQLSLLLLFRSNLIVVHGDSCSATQLAGIGYYQLKKDHIDNNTSTRYFPKNDNYRIDCCGTIGRWRFYIGRPGQISLHVWRPDTDGDYVLIGRSTYKYAEDEIGKVAAPALQADSRIPIQPGDYIGWETAGQDMITYNSNDKFGTTRYQALTSSTGVGDGVDWSDSLAYSKRVYALRADLEPNNPPRLLHVGTTLIERNNLAVGSVVDVVSADDDDVNDKQSLLVTMPTFSEYFGFNQGTGEISIKVVPPYGEYLLNFTVTDRCGEKTVGTITLGITKQALAISNLPAAVSVLESEDNETLLHEITVAVEGTYSCAIRSIQPNELNTFIIRHIDGPNSNFGVYLKREATINYKLIDHFRVNVTCTDGIYTTTGSLDIAVLPNQAPAVLDLPATVYLSTRTASPGSEVYNIKAVDAEGDPIEFDFICEPSSCPFSLGNDGAVTCTESLFYHVAPTSYKILFTVTDGASTTGPLTFTIRITDINTVPEITNLPLLSPLIVQENTPVASPVFKLSIYDGDDNDELKMYQTYVPVFGRSYFRVNTAGEVFLMRPIDFETARIKSFRMDIYVDDGRNSSEVKSLDIVIIDSNEAPVFTKSYYVTSIEETFSGSVLEVLAKDDDNGDSITYAIDCGSKSSYVDIDSTTGEVFLSSEFDLDSTRQNGFTIKCTAVARDVLGDSSTVIIDIVVLDKNDNAPIFSNSHYAVCVKNSTDAGQYVTSVTAMDMDVSDLNNRISFAIVGTSKFSIDSKGNIYAGESLHSWTLGETYSLEVLASDRDDLYDIASVEIQFMNCAGDDSREITSLPFLSRIEDVALLIVSLVLLSTLAGIALVKIIACLRSNSIADAADSSHSSRSDKVDITSIKPRVVDDKTDSELFLPDDLHVPLSKPQMVKIGWDPRI